MPACLSVLMSLPVVGPKIFRLPMPVSKRTSLSPVLSTSTFCSRTALSIGRKFSLSWRSISSLLSPVKLVCGSPSGSVPSDTIVASALPSLKR